MLQKPVPEAPMLTIAATAGAGKTSLAALFPKPAFIMAENGAAVFDEWDDDVKPLVFPPLDTENPMESLVRQLRWFYSNIGKDHDRETLVIDSNTRLDKMFQHEVCVQDNVDNIGAARGGFNKGFGAVAEMHAKVISICEAIKKKGITVIFLSHTKIFKMKNRPDSEDYAIFTIDMHEDSRSHYINNCDGVFFIGKKEFVSGAESNRKGQTVKFGRLVQTGERELITETDGKMGFPDAKTRWSMDSVIDLPKGENPLLTLIPFFNKAQ